MLGMTRGLLYHNAMQLSIPFWLTALSIYSFPGADWVRLGLAAVLGATLPDLDHFSMWRLKKHKDLIGFVKFCIQADRYRKAFLPFHNYAAMLIVAISAAIFSSIDTYVFVFFVSFLMHLLFDYIADLYMIKQHTHWKLRNWLDDDVKKESKKRATRKKKTWRQRIGSKVLARSR